MRQLPIELVLEVIDSIVAGPASRPVAYPASHWRTKLLLAFNTVSRATHTNAKRHLYQHCVYLDSQTRLRRLLRTISGPDDIESDPKPNQNQRHLETRSLITSVYLSPFPGPTIDDLPIAQWTFQLLCILRTSLRRLVVDINFDSLIRWRDHLDVLPTLRAGLEQLECLEEYVSVRDEHNMHDRDPPVYWLRWPNIARLSVFDNSFWTTVVFRLALIPERTTHIVLVSPEALSGVFSSIVLHASISQPLRVTVLSELVQERLEHFVEDPDRYDFVGAAGESPIEVVGASLPSQSAQYQSWGVDEAYQNWVKVEAIAGSLWSVKGTLLCQRRPAS